MKLKKKKKRVQNKQIHPDEVKKKKKMWVEFCRLEEF